MLHLQPIRLPKPSVQIALVHSYQCTSAFNDSERLSSQFIHLNIVGRATCSRRMSEHELFLLPSCVRHLQKSEIVRLTWSSSILKQSLSSSIGLIDQYYDDFEDADLDLIDRELRAEDKTFFDEACVEVDEDELMRIIFESRGQGKEEEESPSISLAASFPPSVVFRIVVHDADREDITPRHVLVWPKIELESLLLYSSKALDKGIFPSDLKLLSLWTAAGEKVPDVKYLSDRGEAEYYLTEFPDVPWVIHPDRANIPKPTYTKNVPVDVPLMELRKEGNTYVKLDSSLRSPVCCVLGHVDAGKTSILDRIRRSRVAAGEAGGITQQIAATLVSIEDIAAETVSINRSHNFTLKIPGILVIDTPGHESFSNLRTRGSTLCDVAILVVDIHSGLQMQTIESIKLLQSKRAPFVIALNKVDRVYGWKSVTNSPFKDSLKVQTEEVVQEFEKKMEAVIAELAMQQVNAVPYYKNKDFRKCPAIVPTSAVTGEGIPDLLLLLPLLSQKFLGDRITKRDTVECNVLEVKVQDGVGSTLDVLLLNGSLNRGDKVMLCTLNGAITTKIQTILESSNMKSTSGVQRIEGAIGARLICKGAEKTLAGTELHVIGPKTNEVELKKKARRDIDSVTNFCNRPVDHVEAELETATSYLSSGSNGGVHVQASSLGSLEALLDFLKVSDIPVGSIGIGDPNKKDVMKSSNGYKCMLLFDVHISNPLRKIAEDSGVTIIAADVIYHLCDEFRQLMRTRQMTGEEQRGIYPFIATVMEEYVMKKADPIIIGMHVDGYLRVGAPLVVPRQGQAWLNIGTVGAIRRLDSPAPMTSVQDALVLIKIDPPKDKTGRTVIFGRDFTALDQIYPKLKSPNDIATDARMQNLGTKEEKAWLRKFMKVYGFLVKEE
ncbi:eukaryotic translation initiation factor 5B [Planoprotostelium fungivorum]|uniref:Eukaryotic translation initiation factor 5B n=1 Tax=Planoprotostelium fungivorum TaxID=1890364 RepID=A0A2P6MSJ2_9EUKA|nr:eukaryotic translation initiation factor 5B [Planoprotostelium fungivorum]